MQNKNGIIILIIVIIVLIIGFVVARKSTEENPSMREDAMVEDQEPEESLSVKHQYKNGEHVFVGTLQLPTPCHSFNAEVDDSKDVPEIKISINEPEGDMMCIQVISEQDFKVTYRTENPDQIFKAYVNGERVRLNVFEVSPDEDIDSFELFIKG